MDDTDELNDLRLQFQALQKQQEKRKLSRIKERQLDEVNASASKDDLELSRQGNQEDGLKCR